MIGEKRERFPDTGKNRYWITIRWLTDFEKWRMYLDIDFFTEEGIYQNAVSGIPVSTAQGGPRSWRFFIDALRYMDTHYAGYSGLTVLIDNRLLKEVKQTGDQVENRYLGAFNNL
jgi:hypothetical protein